MDPQELRKMLDLPAEIAVLKQQMTDVRQAMSDIGENVARIAEMAERQRTHSTGLERLFESNDRLNEKLDTEIKACRELIKVLETDTQNRAQTLHDNQIKAAWMTRGAVIAGTVLIGVIQWFALRELDQYENRLSAIEKRILQLQDADNSNGHRMGRLEFQVMTIKEKIGDKSATPSE